MNKKWGAAGVTSTTICFSISPIFCMCCKFLRQKNYSRNLSSIRDLNNPQVSQIINRRCQFDLNLNFNACQSSTADLFCHTLKSFFFLTFHFLFLKRSGKRKLKQNNRRASHSKENPFSFHQPDIMKGINDALSYDKA